MVFPLGIDPMLAQPSRSIGPSAAEALDKLLLTDAWTFDLKWDGARCLAVVRDGKVRMFSREGNDMTYRYPEVRRALEVTFPVEGPLVLDGEVIVFGPDGRPSFALAHRRDAQQTEAAATRLMANMPATMMIYDILFDVDDVRSMPYSERLELLAGLDLSRVPGLLRFQPPSPDGHTMWAFITEHRLEGLVAKRLSARYRAGRSYDWIKLKTIRSLTALVTGHEPRSGRGAGALALALVDEKHELRPIGHVGSGLTKAHVGEIDGIVQERGFLAAEVQYMDISPDGKLRHPAFKGWRTDVALTDCNIIQLEG